MGFDAATSTRIFRVALTDLGVTMLLPSVLRVVREQAPGIRIQVEPLSGGGLSDKLSSGEVDLVIAVYLGSSGGLRREPLLEEDYVCLVRDGHPLAKKKRATIADYESHGHVAYTPVGFVPRPMSQAVPGIAAAGGIRASVPYLLALPDVVRRTDLVATVPRRLLGAPIRLDGLSVVEAPPELPPVEHAQWWHPRFDLDPAHQWLRARVQEAFG
jgi:DNA-binding transcriptional LysR family regulator